MSESEEHESRMALKISRRERLTGVCRERERADRTRGRKPGTACQLQRRAVNLARNPKACKRRAGGGEAPGYP